MEAGCQRRADKLAGGGFGPTATSLRQRQSDYRDLLSLWEAPPAISLLAFPSSLLIISAASLRFHCVSSFGLSWVLIHSKAMENSDTRLSGDHPRCGEGHSARTSRAWRGIEEMWGGGRRGIATYISKSRVS